MKVLLRICIDEKEKEFLKRLHRFLEAQMAQSDMAPFAQRWDSIIRFRVQSFILNRRGK